MKNEGIIFILFVCSMCLARGSRVKNITHGVSRHIRSIGFPEGSGMGIFFALGVPLDIPDKSILFSFYFEANYGLPGDWNSSYYTEVEHLKKKRNLDRRLAYDIISKQLESNGYSKQDCLLKTICEIAKYSLNGNGLLGDIIRILFACAAIALLFALNISFIYNRIKKLQRKKVALSQSGNLMIKRIFSQGHFFTRFRDHQQVIL